ncbi:MAG: DUF554 domain-containing protein [Oscillospiraceae bacterium]|nr:DUF554 domain-containing protein [Oscillospiraceae bacterium]
MIGLGTIVNIATILVGGALGLVLKRVLAKRIMDTVMQGISLAVIIIGISGTLAAAFTIVDNDIVSGHVLIMIVSLAIGGLIGELLKIEERLKSFGMFCEKKLTKPDDESTFAQGFVTATLVFCIGSMAIVGSLEDGINRNPDILIAKSVIDGIAAMIFASAMGVGVLFSAFTVGIYQGAITLLSVFLAPFLSDIVIQQMSVVGSILIMSIGLNMLKIGKIKTANLLPAIFIPPIYHLILYIVG